MTNTKNYDIYQHYQFGRVEIRVKKSDATVRDEVLQMADDGCPNGPTGDTQMHDLSAIWAKQDNASKN